MPPQKPLDSHHVQLLLEAGNYTIQGKKESLRDLGYKVKSAQNRTLAAELIERTGSIEAALAVAMEVWVEAADPDDMQHLTQATKRGRGPTAWDQSPALAGFFSGSGEPGHLGKWVLRYFRRRQDPAPPQPDWGRPYGGLPHQTPEGRLVWLFCKGGRCRFYGAKGDQIGPERSLEAAVAHIERHNWIYRKESVGKRVNKASFELDGQRFVFSGNGGKPRTKEHAAPIGRKSPIQPKTPGATCRVQGGPVHSGVQNLLYHTGMAMRYIVKTDHSIGGGFQPDVLWYVLDPDNDKEPGFPHYVFEVESGAKAGALNKSLASLLHAHHRWGLQFLFLIAPEHRRAAIEARVGGPLCGAFHEIKDYVRFIAIEECPTSLEGLWQMIQLIKERTLRRRD